jgi:hypothetical protein
MIVDVYDVITRIKNLAKESEIKAHQVNVRVINHCHQFPQLTKNAADKKICTGTENKNLYNV